MALANSINSLQLLSPTDSPTFNALTLTTALPATSGGTAQSTYTTGDILYASNTNTLSKLAAATYPGAALAYDGTNVNWLDPRKYVYFVDDFITAANNTSTSVLSWNRLAANGGGISYNAADTDAAHPGIISIDISTSASSLGGLNTGLVSFLFGGGLMRCDFWSKLSALSDVTDTYIARVGFGDSSVGGAPVDGAYFEYTHGTNSGNWTIVTASNSSRTTANTSTAADTNWNQFTVICNAAGTSVAYLINGVTVANSPIVATIPTGAGRSFSLGQHIIRTSGTSNARSFLVDLVTFYQILTTTR